MGWGNTVAFDTLVGKTMASIEAKGDALITFITDSGDVYEMYHDQDCCEGVYIEDICGDLASLVGSPILSAEESTSNDDPKSNHGYTDDSWTWTFYHLRTMTSTVTIRWYGQSNGYYSESVDLHLLQESN